MRVTQTVGAGTRSPTPSSPSLHQQYSIILIRKRSQTLWPLFRIVIPHAASHTHTLIYPSAPRGCNVYPPQKFFPSSFLCSNSFIGVKPRKLSFLRLFLLVQCLALNPLPTHSGLTVTLSPSAWLEACRAKH